MNTQYPILFAGEMALFICVMLVFRSVAEWMKAAVTISLILFLSGFVVLAGALAVVEYTGSVIAAVPILAGVLLIVGVLFLRAARDFFKRVSEAFGRLRE